MLSKTTRRAPTRKPVQSPVNRCSCLGCRAHIRRLEELNSLLARENDRLNRELREGKRAA